MKIDPKQLHEVDQTIKGLAFGFLILQLVGIVVLSIAIAFIVSR